MNAVTGCEKDHGDELGTSNRLKGIYFKRDSYENYYFKVIPYF